MEFLILVLLLVLLTKTRRRASTADTGLLLPALRRARRYCLLCRWECR
jgi:hypothetical protein